MTANPFLVVGVHYCFRSRTNSDMFFQFVLTGSSDPCDFRCESLDVVFFFFEDFFGDEHGEISVFDTHFLDFGVKPTYTKSTLNITIKGGRTSDCFPDAIGPGFHDVTARNVVIVELELVM